MINKLFCLVCASCLPFLFSLQGEFVFDDSEAVVKNKDITSKSWTRAFKNDYWGTDIRSNFSHKSYRPLTILSFKVNYLLNNRQFSAMQFKLTNLLCHICCCLLVWRTFERLLKILVYKKERRSDMAYLAALLFAVHPIHVEAVSGIVGRADLLAGITFFLSFLCYDKASKGNNCKVVYLIPSVVLAAVSMLCKENGVTVLGFCLAYELVTKFKVKYYVERGRKLNNNTHIYLPLGSIIRIFFIIVSITILLLLRWLVMAGTKPQFKPIDNPAAFSNSFYTKIATYNYIYFINLLILIWPEWLCYDWSMGCIPLLDKVLDIRTLTIISMYLYGILMLSALFRKRNRRGTKKLILMSVSLMVAPFLPAANIFYPVGFVVAERILYVPSAGYCLLLAIGLDKLMHIGRGRGRKILFLLFSILILVYGLRCWERAFEWRNEYILFVSGLAVCPLNAKIHYNVAKVADAHNQTFWALDEYMESIKLYPEYYQAMNNLANMLKNQKKYAEAEYYLRTAIKHKTDFPAAWMNLGIVLATTGNLEESLKAYKNALGYRKQYPDCLYNLGNLYREMNRTKEALDSWLKTINMDQNHAMAWANLLVLLDNSGQGDKALQLIPKALSILPDSAPINFAVANIYGKMDRFEESERFFMKAIKLANNKVQAIHYANLGVLYHRWKKFELARKWYEKALQVDPTFNSAEINIRKLPKNV